jgi:uncharacterized SAM-binding protein YcdF (DUF218 family)
MFVLKKIISAFLVPLPLACVLLVVGLALLWFSKRQKAGKIVATVGLGVLLLGSYDGLAHLTLRPLESGYQPLYPRARLEEATSKKGRHPRWIVVLGGGNHEDPRAPPTEQLGAAALARLAEGVRLYRELPGSKLVLSGGVGNRVKHADLLGAAARVFGVPEQDIVLERSTWDTEQEAHNIAPRLGKDDFILVTSAFHMPRALGLYRREGLDPIPAATAHLTYDTPGFTAYDLLPSPGAMGLMHTALHEYLGVLWSKARGKM